LGIVIGTAPKDFGCDDELLDTLGPASQCFLDNETQELG
jgi:hypothetical protein